jgi:Do/DeqQ family serine protease
MKRLVLTLALVLTTLSPAWAQTQRAVPKTQADVKASFAPLVQKAAPAVVNVYATRKEKQQRNPFMDDPFFRRFFGGGDAAPRERVQRSLGSGVIVDPAGLIVTNHHVVENMTDVKVSLTDKREFDAEIVLRDPRTDLAILRIKPAQPLPALSFGDPDSLEVGDIVLAIGNPFGVGQTVTSGIVSALARTQVGISDYQFFVQTDAAINPGNSGGALVDMEGKLVGINTAIFSQSGGSHGIGFAIPADMVKIVVATAKSGGQMVRRPWFGAHLQNVSSDLVEGLGLDRPTGALVSSVVAKSPAADAGLRTGDVILAFDGQPVTDPDAFGFRLGTRQVGGEAKLEVLRAGKKSVLTVRLVAAPDTRPRDPVELRGRWPLAGATLANLTPALAEELSLDGGDSGVVVSAVKDNSPAAELGLKKGDIIISIDGEPIASSRDAEKVQKSRNYYWKLVINRGGQTMTSMVGG